MKHSIIQNSYDPEKAALYESLFTVGNGHLGIRGAEEERCDSAFRGTFVNGFFDKKTISYGEWAYGYAKNHETILNAGDCASIEVAADGEPFSLNSRGLLAYRRVLDMDSGQVERHVEWESPSGARLQIISRRLASFPRPDIAAMRYEIKAVSSTRLRIHSYLDGSVRNRASEAGDPRVGSHLDADALGWKRAEILDSALLLTGETKRSGMGIAIAASHRGRKLPAASGTGGLDSCAQNQTEGERLSAFWEVDLAAGETFTVDKFIAIIDGNVPEDGGMAVLGGLAERALDSAASARALGFDFIASEQRSHLESFWKGADVEIEGDSSAEEGIVFSIFQLYQSAGRDGHCDLAAKGLTGEGYEGHYFWDTEIFALPFFTYETPEIARKLVEYRIRCLDAARARASELSLPGALYPWRTIDGEETSAYYPAGTAQFHIDADIAYALVRYLRASGDTGLLRAGGAELLFETARLWMGLGFYNPRKNGAFCIPCVTGPDEYTALVDNNSYTNLMAAFNLQEAARAAEKLRVESPEDYGRIADKIALSADESAAWLKASESMYLGRDSEKGIITQDDQFMDRPEWDFASTPPENFPLLLHYHPLMIYRHRVLKQPDTVLAMFLRSDCFSMAEKMRNFRFYEPLTTGDSSLSHSVQSIVAAECGMSRKALAYFNKTVRMDLDDVNGNTRDGVHIAAMAGSWMAAVYGFAGMRDDSRGLSFSPHLPASWKRLAFSIVWRGARLRCEYEALSSRYSLSDGHSVSFIHEGTHYELLAGQSIVIDERPKPLGWIFDLDGVIANTAQLHYTAWKRLASELSLPFDAVTNERLKGVSRLESLNIVLGEMVSEFSAQKKEELAERKNRYYRELVDQLSPADILPGIAELLADLKEAGAKLALASASRNAAAVLERLKLNAVFDTVVDPAALVKGKPDPEIYLRAADQLGLRYRDCIAFEDAQAGIEAIRTAGIFAVGIGCGLCGADYTVPDTAALSRAEIEKAFALVSGSPVRTDK